jgi:alpha-mannosidase
VPFEIVETEEHHAVSLTRHNYPSEYLSERFHVEFLVRDVPPFGFKTLSVKRQEGFGAPAVSSFDKGPNFIQNEHLRVESDLRGRIMVTDLAAGTSYGPLGVLEDGGDAGDEYNWSPPRMDQLFLSDVVDHQVETRQSAFRVELVIRGSFEVPAVFDAGRHARSSATVTIPFETVAYLHPHDRLVRFRTSVDNTARDHRLRVLMDSGCQTNQHAAESAFAIVEREQKQYDREGFSIEVPAAVASMQRFVIIRDDARSAAVIADGLPEYELIHDSKGVVALTLLRCVGQLSRGDLIMRPGGQSGWHNECPDAQCQGKHVFDYAFVPLGGTRQQQCARVIDEAARFTEPLLCKTSVADERSIGGTFLVRATPSVLVVSAAKEAENGDGIIIRVANPTVDRVEGQIEPGWQSETAFEARLDETRGESISLGGDGTIRDTWSPFEVKTFLLETGD